jgi:transcription antitermination factor NusG
MGEDGPRQIAASVIDELKGREDRKGLVQLAPKPKFLDGTPVKTNSGPFAGYPMIYDGMTSRDRVNVLIELLGRKVSVELEEKLLVAA